MKRGGEFSLKSSRLVFLIIIIAFAIVYNINLKDNNLTGYSVSIPTDCSNAQIKATWDSIFKETSSGVNNIYTNGGVINGQCKEYIAYKNNNGLYILSGSYNNQITTIAAIKTNLTQDKINLLVDKNNFNDVSTYIGSVSNNVTLRTSQISSITQA